jgi:Ca-activated chloride channel homolog
VEHQYPTSSSPPCRGIIERMGAALVILALVAALGNVARAQQTIPPKSVAQTLPEPPRFRSASTELVVLPVVVTDRQGRFIPDLPRERFVIYDNGRRQQPTLFTNEDAPVSVALVIDDSGSMRGKLGQVIAAALAFARSSHPEDELFTFEFNDGVRDALDGRSLKAEEKELLQAALKTLVPQGRTALYDALVRALERRETATHARKVLVLMSDGGDNASRATLDDVLANARRSNVTIYTIGLFARGDPDTNPGVLKRLAEATGGDRFLPQSPGPLLQACERIAREIRTGYTIGYPPPDHDGTFHRVRVELDGPDRRRLTVRTRPGYFAGGARAPR